MSVFLKNKWLVYVLYLFLLYGYFLPASASGIEDRVSLNLQNMSIQDVLHMLAKVQHKNIIISPSIHGSTSLNVSAMTHAETFDRVLIMHDLHQWKINGTWFVGSKEEFFQQKELEKKVKALTYEALPIVTRVWQIRYAKALDIAHLLEDSKYTLVSKRGVVSVDVRTNMLCVRDVEPSMEVINKVIRRLDIPVRQVLIEAHLASIDSDYERELGIVFSGGRPRHDDSGLPPASEKNARYRLAILNLADGARLDIKLSALERAGHGELISSPSLFTASQQMAIIESGEEIPYQESSSSGATSVTFKKAVLSLKVTPQVMPDNQILLQLQVNQDKPSKRMVLGVPAINTRHITTNLQVKAGQTVVLGGIYEFSDEYDEQAIPFLSNLPLIGWLFKQQDKVKTKRELLIFVTPTIMS